MKRNNIIYWITTLAFAGFMIWSSVPGINPKGETLKFLHEYMGYPIYFIQFISWAKIAGSLVILIPGLNRMKEWAYAGLFFDLAGALFSVYQLLQKPDPGMLFILLPALLGAVSYLYWHKTKTAA